MLDHRTLGRGLVSGSDLSLGRLPALIIHVLTTGWSYLAWLMCTKVSQHIIIASRIPIEQHDFVVRAGFINLTKKVPSHLTFWAINLKVLGIWNHSRYPVQFSTSSLLSFHFLRLSVSLLSYSVPVYRRSYQTQTTFRLSWQVVSMILRRRTFS